MTTRYPPLADLLAEHGLSGAVETPLAHTGFSGATLTHIIRPGGAAFVLKRMSIDRDWIMCATDDTACREAAFARASLNLGAAAYTPNLGSAQDGSEYALLMRDITDDLLPETAISVEQLDIIMAAMAAIHGGPTPEPHQLPWCDGRQRLLLLTPRGAAIAKAYGAPVADDLREGWRLFGRYASSGVVRIIRGLFDDPSPLLRTLAEMPPVLLHGDLKLDNIGIAPDGGVWLIDWAMPMLAPPAIELGWFLAINSRRLPVGLDDVMRRYGEAANVPAADRERHDALAVLCGLLLRGWRKALDAEAGEPEELRWWCEGTERAVAFL